MQNKEIFINKAKMLAQRYSDLTELISAPEINIDKKLLKKLSLERSRIESVALLFAEFLSVENELKENITLLRNTNDGELSVLLLAENERLTARKEGIEASLGEKLLKSDDGTDILISVFSAESSEKSRVLIEELNQIYIKIAKENAYAVKKTDKGIIIEGGLNFFKNENGIHRIENIDITVNADVPREEFIVNADELKYDTFRASGAGGQNVNKVESAVRVTHIPSGVAVVCREERSQLQNKEKATERLIQKLNEDFSKTSKKKFTLLREYDLKNKTVKDNSLKKIFCINESLFKTISEIIEHGKLDKIKEEKVDKIYR